MRTFGHSIRLIGCLCPIRFIIRRWYPDFGLMSSVIDSSILHLRSIQSRFARGYGLREGID